MRAVTFQGAKDIKVKNGDDPKIEKHDDIHFKITSTAICGSDLHIYLRALPTHKDYVIGHEPIGIVEKAGQKMKLQGGTFCAIDITNKSVRKFGTIQLTGVYCSL